MSDVKNAPIEEQRIALRLLDAHIQDNKESLSFHNKECQRLSTAIAHLDRYRIILKQSIREAEAEDEKLVATLKGLKSIGEAAVLLAKLSTDNTITAQYAKKMISDRAQLGSESAIFAYFSRTEDFETVDRGKYKLITATNSSGGLPPADDFDDDIPF